VLSSFSCLLASSASDEGEISPDTYTCENLHEGDECHVGDVTVKVKSIDETLAPCTLSGENACSVESVDAQIVDENDQAMGSEVKASVPYKLTSMCVLIFFMPLIQKRQKLSLTSSLNSF